MKWQLATIAALLAIYSGGAYQAWRALHVYRAPLPLADLQQASGSLGLNSTSIKGTAQTPPLGCVTPLRLRLLWLVANPWQQQRQPAAAAADSSQRLEQELPAALARLQPLLGTDEVEVSASTLLHPPPLPEAARAAGSGEHVLDAAASAAWAEQLLQLAWSVQGAHLSLEQQQRTAQVLIYEPAAANQPLLLTLGSGSGSSQPSSSLVLADGSLLLIRQRAKRQLADGGGSTAGSGMQHLAAQVAAWLELRLSSTDSSDDGSSLSSGSKGRACRLAAACTAAAVGALNRFVGTVSALPGMPVSPELAGTAAAALQAAQAAIAAGDDPAALLHARQAWRLAAVVEADVRFGQEQHFPPEHVLAVLLPLGMPVTLVLAQVAGRAAKGWREERRKGRKPATPRVQEQPQPQQQQAEQETQGSGPEQQQPQMNDHVNCLLP